MNPNELAKSICDDLSVDSTKITSMNIHLEPSPPVQVTITFNTVDWIASGLDETAIHQKGFEMGIKTVLNIESTAEEGLNHGAR